jgi:HSP20 family protein
MLPIRRSGNWLPGIFNDFFEHEGLRRLSSTSPAINIIEGENEYKVEVAAPGMSKDDFKICINDENQLVVTLERKEEHNEEERENKYLRREFSYSRFEQAMLLPDHVLKDRIEASMVNGVLTIIIPKDTEAPERPKERRIEIKG